MPQFEGNTDPFAPFAVNEEVVLLKKILRQVVNDLPTKRDWLDPALEREMRKAIK